MRLRLPITLALAAACDPAFDGSGPGSEETGFDRDCVERIEVHPVCDCALTLSWSVHDTVEQVGLVVLSSSAEDAQTAICTDGLSSELLATAVYSDVTTSDNQVTIDPLSGPTIIILESGGDIVDRTIADASSSNTLAYLSFHW